MKRGPVANAGEIIGQISSLGVQAPWLERCCVCDPVFYFLFFKCFTIFKVNFSFRHRRYQSARGLHAAASSLKAAEGTE